MLSIFGNAGCFVLVLEWMPPRGRTFATSIPSFGFPFGQLLLAGVAFGIRDWRWQQFSVSAPFFIIFLYSWFLPESARWLVLNDRSPQAIRNLRKVARINGKKDEGDKLTVEGVEGEMKGASSTSSSYSILDLVRTVGMRKISCCLMYVWFSTSLGFYALAMDVQNFGINIFLVQVSFGAVDIIAKQAAISAMDYCGRRGTLIFCLVSAGLLVITNTFVPQDMRILRTVLATLGKGFLAGAFTGIFMYSGEMYPTAIRQTGLGFLSMNARIGAMVAPVIGLIGSYVSFLPSVIYGVAAITAGVSVCALIETRNTLLLDTVAEVEQRMRGKLPQEGKEEVPLTQKKASSIFKDI